MWIWIFIGTLFQITHMKVFVYYHLTEIVFFALGGLFLVREITRNNVAAVIAFIILLFSGDASYWINQIYSLSVIEYVPWILFSVIKYFRKQTIVNAIVFAIILSISTNIYYPVYLMTFGITLLLLLFIFHFHLLIQVDYKKLFRHILVIIPVICMLILPTYLAYSEINYNNYQISRFGGPDQKEEDTGFLLAGNCDLKAKIKGIFTSLYIPSEAEKYHETEQQVGILAVTFMAMGLLAFTRNGLFWFSVLLFMYLNAFGRETPYYYLSSHIMPFYKIIKTFTFFSGFITISAAVLACIGVVRLLQELQRKDVSTKIISWKEKICCLVLFIGLIIFLPEKDRVAPIVIALILIIWHYMVHRYVRYNFALNIYKNILIISFLVIGVMNLAVNKKLIYHNVTASMFSYKNKFNYSFIRPEQYTSAQLNLFFDNSAECCSTFYHIAEKIDGPLFFDNWGAAHTLFVDREYYLFSAVKGFEETMKYKLHFLRYYTVSDRVEDYEYYIGKSVLVLKDDKRVNFRNAKLNRAEVAYTPAGQIIFPFSISLLKKTANTVSFDVTVQKNVFLLYTDLYHKGFNATVDGNNVPILKGMGIFKAIELPEGRHVVKFTFNPFYKYPLLIYLIISIGFFILSFLYCVLKAWNYYLSIGRAVPGLRQ